MESHAASSLASWLVPALRDTQNNLDWKESLQVVLSNLPLKAGLTLGLWIGGCPFDRFFFLTVIYSGFQCLSCHCAPSRRFFILYIFFSFLYIFLLVRDNVRSLSTISNLLITPQCRYQTYTFKTSVLLYSLCWDTKSVLTGTKNYSLNLIVFNYNLCFM